MRYLEWCGFPLKSLPSNFCPEKLVKLCFRNSNLQKLWNGVQDFVSLQEIDLCGSKQLQELPNLSRCLNLKVVVLANCESLCSVHSSILSLHSLVELNLHGCKKLQSLKSELHLRSLRYIVATLCTNLKEFSMSSDELRRLHLTLTGIEILHPSIWHSSKLEALDLSGSRLANPPNQLPCLTSLTVLCLSRCEVIDDLKLHIFFNSMLSLRVVTLDGCGNIIELPNNTRHLLGLEWLSIRGCRRLRSLPELPPSVATLDAGDCTSLEIVSTFRPRPSSGKRRDLSFERCVQLNEQSLQNIMEAAAYSITYYISHTKKNYSCRCSICVPGSRVPEWFKYRAAQSSVIVELPPISDLADFFFCVVLGFHSEINHDRLILECKWYLEGFAVALSRHRIMFCRDMKSDHVFMWNDGFADKWRMDAIIRNQQLLANIKLRFEFSVVALVSNGVNPVVDVVPARVMIKECGVWPLSVSECQKFVEQMEMEGKKERPHDVEDQQPPLQLKKFKSDEDTHADTCPGTDEMNTLL